MSREGTFAQIKRLTARLDLVFCFLLRLAHQVGQLLWRIRAEGWLSDCAPGDATDSMRDEPDSPAWPLLLESF